MSAAFIDRQPKSELTPREYLVASMLGKGWRPRDISLKLGVHKNAVNSYSTRAMQKLGLYNRHQLAKYAREKGWTPPADRDSASGGASIGGNRVDDLSGNPTTPVVDMEAHL